MRTLTKEIKITATVVMLMLNVSMVQAINVSMSVDYVGDSYFEITASLDPQVSTDDEFYLDVSFPYGVQSVSIINENDWSADIYNIDDQIYHRYNGPMDAEYILVSGYIDYADGYQNLDLKLRVYPNMSGEITVFYRGTRWNNGVVEISPNDGYGCDYDQQGWPVYCETVMFGPDELPDLDITDIKVNNNNPYYVGEEVQLKAYVSEINSQDAGSAEVEFYVDGSYVGYDYTANMDADESHTAYIYYTFNEPGIHEVEAIVDPDDDIPEDNEENNSRTENTTTLENHAPVVTITNIAINGLNATLTWNGSDQDGHSILYSWQIDGGSWSSWNTSTSHTFTNLSENTHSFCVRAEDELNLIGNSDCENFTITINHAPVVTISNVNVNEQSVSISWNGNDVDNDNILYRYRLDSQAWSSWSSSNSTTYNDLTIGNHTFYVQCEDEHGLVGNTDSQTFYIAEINHEPTIQIVSIDIDNQNVVINLSTNDPDGDQVYVRHKLHNEAWSEWHQNLTISYFDLPSSDYTFFVECKDEHNLLGNSTSQDFAIGNPDENDYADWGEPGTFAWIAYAIGATANQQYGYTLAENIPVVGSYIIDFLDSFDPATAQWSIYQVDNWPASYKTNWFTILDNSEYLVKIRWKDLLYTSYDNMRGIWPEIEIEHRLTNQRFHLKGLQRFDVENIGNHVKIINNANLMTPLSGEYPGLGRAAMVSQEGYLSIYSSIHLLPDPPSWYTILEQPELINTEFNIKTINPRIGNGPANSWTSIEGSIDDIRNFFRQDRSFRIATPATASSAKLMQYLSNGGKILTRIAIGVVILDIGYSLLQNDWQGAVCDATSFGTSYVSATVIAETGVVVCGPLWFAGGVPGAMCTVGAFITAGVVSYFTYEVTQDVCADTWDYISVESDMFGETISISNEELMEIDEELQTLGINTPMQVIIESDVVENSGSYPALLEIITPDSMAYTNNDSNHQMTTEYMYSLVANDDSLDMVFSLNNADNGDYQIILNNPSDLNNTRVKVNRQLFGSWVIDSASVGTDTVFLHLESFDVTSFLTASSTIELNHLIANADQYNISEIRIAPGVYYPDWYILNNNVLKLVGESASQCILDYQGSMGLTFLNMDIVEVSNLTIRNTNPYAINIQSANQVVVKNSIFYNNIVKGIAVIAVDSTLIANNSFVGVNGSSIWNNNSNTYVVNNTISESSVGVEVINEGTALLEYNNLTNNLTDDSGNVQYGNGNINHDPLFINAEQNNFHLLPNSPLIDAGHPNFYFEKEPAPNGNRINIGAFGNTAEAQVSTVMSTSNDTEIPLTYSLSQNYPNPFNPTTHIDYTLAQTCPVELKLFSLTGQTVLLLVNGVQAAGHHTTVVNLRQSNLPSGIYFYRLVTPEFQATRKITYLK